MNFSNLNFQKISKWTISIIVLITLWSVWQLNALKISYDFEAFFPKSNPDLKAYNSHTASFGADNDYVLLAIESDEIFTIQFLTALELLVSDLQLLPHVEDVIGLPTIKKPIITPMGVLNIPLFDINQFNAQKVEAKIMQDPQLVGSLISENKSTTAIIINTTPNLSKIDSDATLSDIYKTIKKHKNIGVFHIAGRIHAQQYFIDLMFWELIVFGISSALLLALFLFLSYRSWWGIVLPIAVVVCTVTWLMAGLSVSNQSINLLTTIMPTILFVVGVSDVVHLTEKYLEELRLNVPKKRALINAIKDIGLATFLTSLTTSIGFLTLLSSGMMPIQEFGVFTAIGVWIAYLLAFTLIPSALYLLPVPYVAKQHNNKWNTFLKKCFLWVIKHPKKIITGTLVVIGVASIGLSNVQVNNFLLEDLNENDPVKQEYRFFEKTFDGVRPFEIALIGKKDNKLELTYDLMQDLFLLESYLIKSYEIKTVMGLPTIAREMNQAIHEGLVGFQKKPERNDWIKIKKLLSRLTKSGKLDKLIDLENTKIRFSARVTDYGGKVFSVKNKELIQFWQTLPASKKFNLNVTGMANLIDRNNELLSKNMMVGLLIAFGLIAIIIGILFKSFSYVFIAIIPNILPLILIAGVMGYVGIDLKISTSLIFTIAFGIAVDDTIHFLSRYKLELGKGKTRLYALKSTYLYTGKAILITSIILCAGFWTLIFSSFMSTFYIGVLISLTLLFAVLCDLILLPVLLLWVSKPKS
jgi:predicted RND superfamily exporter protein